MKNCNHNGNVEKRDSYRTYSGVFMCVAIVGVACCIVGFKNFFETEYGWKAWMAGILCIGFGFNGYNYFKNKAEILDRGIQGENMVSSFLRQLPNEYEIFDNIPICFGERCSEIDSLVISPYGIWIVEVKNHRGVIYGNVNDPSWVQYKDSRSYRMKNAVRQANRQMSILKDMLREKGLDTYINVMVALPSADCVEIDSKQIYTNLSDLKDEIQSHSSVRISQDKINKIKNLLIQKAGHTYSYHSNHYWFNDMNRQFQQQQFDEMNRQFQQQVHQEEINRFMDESMRFSMNNAMNSCNDAMHAADHNFTSPMNPF